MNKYAYFSILFFALASQVEATVLDNSVKVATIDSGASTLNGEGNYIFTNVKTGKTLSFVRTDLTNLYPNDGNDPLAVQFSGTQVRLSGANNKCVSAQWKAYSTGGGYDHAAVSYACKVGTGLLTGTDSLEPTKQWWYLIPTGSSTDDSSDDSDSDSSEVVLAAVAKKTTTSTKATSTRKTTATSTRKATAKASSSTAAATATASTSVDPHNRLTWPCRHPGWWLSRHPEYTTTHPECKKTLKAYRASNRLRQRLQKRRLGHNSDSAPIHRSSKRAQSYFIVAVDHILDMEIRAIGSETVSTFGGYQSTVLNVWDESDTSQMWTITSA